MNTNIRITSRDDFRTWQQKAQQLFKDARAEEMSLINEEFKEVLADHKELQAASERIIKDFTALLDRQPKSSFSWESDSEILGAHIVAMAEMERINGEFLKKWGTRYEEYLAVTDALEKEVKRAMARTKSRAAYKEAMANLAGEEGEHNA